MSEWLPETAVITGGASGIGFALAQRLTALGTKVMIADLSGATLDRAAAELGAFAHECDVCDAENVAALVVDAFDKLGHVDLLLNNAGKSGPSGKPLWEISFEEAQAHFEVNFWGVWRGCAMFAPRMIASERKCAIFNTASENSFFCAMPRMAAYIAAKHAVLGMTENLREDLPPRVHAGVIVPGWVFTGIGPEEVMRHGMEVGEYADIALPQILARRRFVVSHRSNLKRIDERIDEVRASYAEFATDDDKDVRDTVSRLRGG